MFFFYPLTSQYLTTRQQFLPLFSNRNFHKLLSSRPCYFSSIPHVYNSCLMRLLAWDWVWDNGDKISLDIFHNWWRNIKRYEPDHVSSKYTFSIDIDKREKFWGFIYPSKSINALEKNPWATDFSQIFSIPTYSLSGPSPCFIPLYIIFLVFFTL